VPSPVHGTATARTEDDSNGGHLSVAGKERKEVRKKERKDERKKERKKERKEGRKKERKKERKDERKDERKKERKERKKGMLLVHSPVAVKRTTRVR
jgi:hypothetical protein